MPTGRATAEDLPGDWRHREALVNGVRLHYVEAGQGPLVVLLHGFPEFWYSWRLQIPILAQAGFHVLAPDLRGYNLSEKPPGVASYRLPLLMADVVELIRHAGAERAAVVGHDWGGVIAWQLAMTRPEHVERLAILNAPHPALFQRALRRPTQRLRSWYIRFFQLPYLPELVCRWHRFALLRRTLARGAVGRGREGKRDLERYVAALSRPGALTAALHYYRAVIRETRRGALPAARVIDRPVMVLWGERDPYLGPWLTEGLEEWVTDLRLERLPRAGHWLQVQAAAQVNRSLVDFLNG